VRCCAPCTHTAVAGLENALLAKGMTVLGVRRLASSSANALTAVALVGFGLASSATQATAAYCALKAAETLHSSVRDLAS
jgi:hypothetical protein